MDPKFSIIIPVYNVAPYLRECLDSVLAQTFTDWESICVDDGSTDGGGAILDGYAARDSRFRVIHKPNGGVGSARNAALDVAKGDWIWFVDSDDMIHPRALAFLDDVCSLHPEVETISFTTQHEESALRWEDSLPIASFAEASKARTCEALRFHRRAAWGTLVRRSSIQGLRFANLTIGEDGVFLSHIFWRTGYHAYLPAPIYYYRARVESAVHSDVTANMLRDFLLAELVMLKNIEKFSTQSEYAEMCKYVAGSRDLDWYGHMGMFSRASGHVLRDSLGLWIDLQKARRKFASDGLVRHMIVFLISVFKSPWLANRSLLWQSRVNRHLLAKIGSEV